MRRIISSLSMFILLVFLLAGCEGLFEKNVTSDEDIQAVFSTIKSDSLYTAMEDLIPQTLVINKRSTVNNASLLEVATKLSGLSDQLEEFSDEVDETGSGTLNINVDFNNINLDLTKLSGGEESLDIASLLSSMNIPTNLATLGLSFDKLAYSVNCSGKTASDVTTLDGNLSTNIEASFLPNIFISQIGKIVNETYQASIINPIGLAVKGKGDYKISATREYYDNGEFKCLSSDDTTGKINVDNSISLTMNFTDEAEYKGSFLISFDTEVGVEEVGTFMTSINDLVEETCPSVLITEIEVLLEDYVSTSVNLVSYSSKGEETYSKSFKTVEEFYTFIDF